MADIDTTAIDPAIIARIRKLQALAADAGANENEANSAAEKAQALMRQHNLTMATIEAAGGSASAEGGKRIKEKAAGFAMYEWQQRLMDEVARVNFCYNEVIWTYKGSRRIGTGFRLIGREANVIAARELYAYLRQTAERLAREYVGGSYRKLMTREAMSFKAGLAYRLRLRLAERHDLALAEQKREAEERRGAAPSTGTALVLLLEDVAQAEADANEDHRLAQPAGTAAARRREYARTNKVRKAISDTLDAFKDCGDQTLLLPPARAAAQLAAQQEGITDEDAVSLIERLLERLLRWHLETVADAAARANETPAQKAKREAKEAREGEKADARYQKRREAYWASKDVGAWHDGDAQGKEIGLDQQITEEEKRRLN